MLDFKYFKLSISIGDNLFKFLNLEIIAWIVLYVCVFLNSFNTSKRIYKWIKVFSSSKGYHEQ